VRLVIEVRLADVDGALAADAPFAALEAVVRQHEHRRASEIDVRQQATELFVLVAIPLAHDALVALEARVVDPRQPRRRVLHEQVREAVDLLEVEEAQSVVVLLEQLPAIAV